MTKSVKDVEAALSKGMVHRWFTLKQRTKCGHYLDITSRYRHYAVTLKEEHTEGLLTHHQLEGFAPCPRCWRTR